MSYRKGAVPAAAAPGLAIALLMLDASAARAYVDPGTGSIILQLLAAGLITCMVVFRKSIARIAGVFRRGKGPTDTQP